MTNNIEKLYELAKVEKLNKVSIHLNKAYNFEFHETDTKSDFYPPFSNEKQLRLIKWLLLYPMTDEISLYFHEPTQTYNFNIFFITEIRGCRDSRIECNNSFEQTLAGLVCELWEDLTLEQREEVRGILQ